MRDTGTRKHARNAESSPSKCCPVHSLTGAGLARTVRKPHANAGSKTALDELDLHSLAKDQAPRRKQWG